MCSLHRIVDAVYKTVGEVAEPITDNASEGPGIRENVHYQTNSKHDMHHDSSDDPRRINAAISTCEEGGERHSAMMNSVTDRVITVKNDASKISLMAFDGLGNVVWKHGVYPYENQYHPYAYKRRAYHEEQLEEHKDALPTNGKARYSVQLHFRLREGKIWEDWVAIWKQPVD